MILKSGKAGMETREAREFRMYQRALEQNPHCSASLMYSSMFGGGDPQSPYGRAKWIEFRNTPVPKSMTDEEFKAQEDAFYASIRKAELAYFRKKDRTRKNEAENMYLLRGEG